MSFLHRVFGTTLDADVPFPELRAASAPAADGWALRIETGVPSAPVVEACGSETLPDGVVVALGRIAAGWRITYADTGSFDIESEVRCIRWYRRDGVSVEAMRIDVLSRVLAVALHASGRCCLHASAASVGGQAIGLLAPKGTGKSTLAVALARAGAPLLTDDALALDLTGRVVMALPGVQSVRLWDDAARRLALAAAPAAEARKHLLCALDPALLEETPAPLAALYLLQPAAADATLAAVRQRLAPLHAAVVLAAHAKLGALATGALAPAILAQAATIARTVPVYALRVARDLARVDEAVAALLDWHAGALAEPLAEARS